MLLKTRRDFTLCFFLFAPLGMAGYAADSLAEGSSVAVEGNITSKPVRNLAAQPGSNAHASPERGGQVAPVSASGGLSGAERVSRLLVDGRKAYRDGNLKSARTHFVEALSLDSSNPEAKRYLGEIERQSDGSQFTADAPLGGVPVKRNTPAPAVVAKPQAEQKAAPSKSVKEVLSASAGQVELNASESLKSDSQRFSKSVAQADSFSAPVKAQLKNVDKAAADAGEKSAPQAKPESKEVASLSKPGTVKSSAGETAKPEAAKPEASSDKTQASKPEVKSGSDSEAKATVVSLPKLAGKLQNAIKPVVVAKPADAPKAESKKVSSAAEQKAEVKKDTKVAAPAAKANAPAVASMEMDAELLAAFDELASEAKQVASAAKPQAADHPMQPAAVESKTITAAPAAKDASEPKAEVKSSKQAAEQKPVEKTKDAKALESEKSSADAASKKSVESKADAKAAKETEVSHDKNAKAKSEASKSESSDKEKAEAKSTKGESADKPEARKPSAETAAAIKLYNSGKYDEAASRLKALLVNDPSDSEAKDYLQRSEQKIAAAAPKASKLPTLPEAKVSLPPAPAKEVASVSPPLLDINKLKQGDSADEKESKTEKKGVVAQAPANLKPLGEVLSKDSSAPAAKPDEKADAKPSAASTPSATAATPSATDPIVEADKLFRQAQRELQEGKREDALSTAKKATALDANNAEAKAMVADLSGSSSAGSGAKSLPSLQAVTAPATAPAATAPVATAPETAAASTTLASGSTAPAVVGVDALLVEGRNKFQAGNLREALTSFKAVLDKDPANAEAKDYVQRIEAEKGTATEVTSAVPDKDAPKAGTGLKITAQAKARDAEAAFQQGLVAYQAGRLDVAVQHWNYALTLDRSHPRAIQYLEQTRGEYDAWVQQHQYNALELQKEVVATEKLDTPVTYDTAGQKTIVEFLSAMSLITDISFYVTDGVDPEIRVTAKFDDQPLHDALDVVMLPIGLKWSRTADVVTVTPDLRTKFFNLTPEQVGRLKTLLENKTLQRYLYGPEGVPPMRNVELTLDDRENLLSVTDSQENINKIEAFVKDLQANGPMQLVYRNWKIRPEEGAKIKSLVEAIVRVQSDAPYDLERKVVVDGDDLIVKDTAENVAKIEQLLLDKNFLRKLETQKLSVATYNLVPREPLKDNVEQVRDLAQSVVTVVKTILYAQSTESAAAAEGRRYWFDPNTLQLTVTDFPENLRVVGDYIRSLPMLGTDQAKSEIIFLKHQTTGDMVDLLNRVLGLESSVAADGGTGESVTKTLRVEGELTFRDLKIRITKVNENDVINDNDDSVEMVVRTATSSEDRTIEEFRSDFIDEYELNVIEVRPSSTPGEGSARIEIRYNPGGTSGVAGVAPVVPAAGVAGAAVIGPDGQIIPGTGGVEEAAPATTLQVEPIDNMNALLVRYEDPGDLAQVKSWLEQLDIPVLQVSIETKLVEVNETRVKQFMPEFNVLNLGNGGIDFGSNVNSVQGLGTPSIFNGLEDPAYPLANHAQNADLLNPVSVFNIITGGDTPLNFTLRMLESEGVLNMVNGPHITVENGESASFEIELTAPGLSAALINTNQNQQQGGQATGFMQQVEMEVTPQITQLGEIRLQIDSLELNDRGHRLGNVSRLVSDDQDDSATGANPALVTRSLGDIGAIYDNRRRALQTVARVQNHGTIVLGGWTGEHSLTNDAGIPILRNIPYVGKLLFGQTNDRIEKTNLLIFLTCHLIEP